MNRCCPASKRQQIVWPLRRYRPAVYAVVFTLLGCPPSVGQVRNLNDELEEVRQRRDVCALGALVVTDGQVAAQGACGTLTRNSDQPVTADARWHLGSCAKSMTATLAAVMVQQGLLDWELTLADVFADESFQLHEDYRQVTLNDLLAHRAGAPNDLVGSTLWRQLLFDAGGSAPEQREKIVATYLPRGPALPPQTKFQYSNVGYVVAGRMLEKRGGQSFETLLVDLVFKPLDINSAGFGPPLRAEDPRGHRLGLPMPQGPWGDNPPGLSSAGRVHMTLEDWSKYVMEHLRAARGEETKLLTGDSARRLQRPVGDGDYALGWGLPQVAGLDGPVFAHAGSNTMWFAQVIILPGQNAAFLLAANEGSEAAQQAVRDVLRMLADRYAPSADVLAAREQGQVPLNALAAGFTLKVKDESGLASATSPLFVASNHNDWNPGDPAWQMRQQDGLWVLRVPITSGDERMELKVTRGNWETVEVDAELADIPNRTVGFAAPETTDAVMEFSVPAFADQRD